MPPRNKSASVDRDALPTTDHMDRLCAAYERIADEIAAMRRSLDRLYHDLGGALANADTLLDFPGQLAALGEPNDDRSRDDTDTDRDTTSDHAPQRHLF